MNRDDAKMLKFILWFLVVSAVAMVAFSTCGCSAREQSKPIIQPPTVIEVKVPVPVPCPAPPELPQLDLWLPLMDPEMADVQTIMRIMAHDLLSAVMAYQQATELLRIYVQQGEVASSTVPSGHLSSPTPP